MPTRARSALFALAAAAVVFGASEPARSQVTWTTGGVTSSGLSFRVPSFVGYSRTAGIAGFDGVWFTSTGIRPIAGTPLVEIARRTDPQIRAGFRPSTTEEPTETAPPDRGLVAFARGDYETAYNEYAVRARFRPNDLEARRLQGLAAAGRNNFDEAGQIFLEVYAAEPGLRHARVPAREVIGTDAVRKLIAQGARRAESVNTREAWFAVAVLSHAAGQPVAAEAFYERSQQAPPSKAP
ncbi:MAG: hypothetical protein AAGI30_04180 [Planctomycetota bacterium]